MDLNGLYTKLSVDKLNNLSLANDGDGTISNAKKPQIVAAAMDGLRRLHTRFLLQENSLVLVQAAYLTQYKLTPKYARSSFTENAGHTFYIDDTPTKPFNDDVIKVLSVYDGHANKLPLNDPTEPASVFSTGSLLQVPHPEGGAPLSVTYQAGHPELSVDRPDQEIELPSALEEALLSYVAAKVFSGMNSQETLVIGAEHMKTFESICVEAAVSDLVSTDTLTGATRFERNGWV